MKRRTAPEIIATHIGWDMAEVSEGRYQPTRHSNPSVYVAGEDYYCAPARGKLPEGFDWVEDGEVFGRKIYKSTPPAEVTASTPEELQALLDRYKAEGDLMSMTEVKDRLRRALRKQREGQ